MMAASSSAEPSRAKAAPRPALKRGSSSSIRTATVTASRLEPPRSRISYPPSSTLPRLASYSRRWLSTTADGTTPAPPCMTRACIISALLEGDTGVRELVGIRAGMCGDELARRHLVFGIIDGIDGEQLAAAEITCSERTGGWIATQHDSVVSDGDADDDEL